MSASTDAALAAILGEAPALPWERQKGETEEEFERFVRYRDRKPPRGRVIGPGMGSTTETFRMYQDLKWKERVEAYDRFFERITLEERAAFTAQHARERAADHLMLTHELFEFALLEARKYLHKAKSSEGAGLFLKPAELVKIAELAMKMERLIAGDPTERVENTGADMSSLSLDELDQLTELLQKAEGTENKGPH